MAETGSAGRQSVGQPVSHSVIQSLSQSLSQPVSHSVIQSVGHSVSQSVTQSSSQSVTQPVSHSVSQPVGHSVSQSVTQSASQSVTGTGMITFPVTAAGFISSDGGRILLCYVVQCSWFVGLLVFWSVGLLVRSDDVS